MQPLRMFLLHSLPPSGQPRHRTHPIGHVHPQARHHHLRHLLLRHPALRPLADPDPARHFLALHRHLPAARPAPRLVDPVHPHHPRGPLPHREHPAVLPAHAQRHHDAGLRAADVRGRAGAERHRGGHDGVASARPPITLAMRPASAPQTYYSSSPVTTSVFLWTLSFFLFVMGVFSMMESLVRRTIHFEQIWWCMVFPITGFVLATIDLGEYLRRWGCGCFITGC
ncbi:hypothetical protein BO71DRAFT_94049 [Aspergillus ellipticus CBS 707.79]|uniref:Uncharacterized protein n=1 Tax=Aspergillus ellipticus CBS 707.79 TaxID=1448320 RepID=A0A319D605_9EURO|nr:hypothetical protein BO71DRAFT_94049 [Aspergillus ellipticus CBS 707.79]